MWISSAYITHHGSIPVAPCLGGQLYFGGLGAGWLVLQGARGLAAVCLAPLGTGHRAWEQWGRGRGDVSQAPCPAGVFIEACPLLLPCPALVFSETTLLLVQRPAAACGAQPWEVTWSLCGGSAGCRGEDRALFPGRRHVRTQTGLVFTHLM